MFILLFPANFRKVLNGAVIHLRIIDRFIENFLSSGAPPHELRIIAQICNYYFPIELGKLECFREYVVGIWSCFKNFYMINNCKAYFLKIPPNFRASLNSKKIFSHHRKTSPEKFLDHKTKKCQHALLELLISFCFLTFHSGFCIRCFLIKQFY